MDKEDVVHICVEYYSANKKNEVMPFAATWMNLEIIILSEVSQNKVLVTRWKSSRDVLNNMELTGQTEHFKA